MGSSGAEIGEVAAGSCGIVFEKDCATESRHAGVGCLSGKIARTCTGVVHEIYQTSNLSITLTALGRKVRPRSRCNTSCEVDLTILCDSRRRDKLLHNLRVIADP